MIRKMSVGQLYPLALAEGEGVGTAYEYLAKRLVLAPWLGKRFRPGSVVIAAISLTLIIRRYREARRALLNAG